MKRLAWLVFATVALNAPVASAQFIVEDPANLVQNIQQVLAQAKDYAEQVKHYQQMLKDYENQIDQLEAMVGSRGVAILANGASEKLGLRRYMPTDWSELMYLREGSGFVPNHLKKWTQNIAYLRNTLPQKAGHEAFGNEPIYRVAAEWERMYDDQRLSNEAFMGQAMTATSLTQDRLNNVEFLIGQMESGGDGNDLKRSVDLNTRMSGEVALLLAELNRTMALQAYAQGNASRRELRNQVLYYRTGKVDE